MIFLDASAAVKAYVTEKGSGEIRSAISDVPDLLYLTPHVVLEVLSTLAKQRRGRKVDGRTYRRARKTFLAELPGLHLLPVDPPAFGFAGDLIDRHRHVAIGAMDALHLACALDMQTAWPQEKVIIASSDHALLSLARATGLRTFDPETESYSSLRSRLN